ncbi:MAG: hypothetical protein HXX17_07930 [Geobacteraceae bacterium]|nr:hypothetical protein [Geobacteraceae bacterium]
MATSKVNTSRFLAKGGDRGQKVGGVYVSPVTQGNPANPWLAKGGTDGGKAGGRMAGLATNAKVRTTGTM